MKFDLFLQHSFVLYSLSYPVFFVKGFWINGDSVSLFPQLKNILNIFLFEGFGDTVGEEKGGVVTALFKGEAVEYKQRSWKNQSLSCDRKSTPISLIIFVSPKYQTVPMVNAKSRNNIGLK